jgi:hypothetical protein
MLNGTSARSETPMRRASSLHVAGFLFEYTALISERLISERAAPMSGRAALASVGDAAMIDVPLIIVLRRLLRTQSVRSARLLRRAQRTLTHLARCGVAFARVAVHSSVNRTSDVRSHDVRTRGAYSLPSVSLVRRVWSVFHQSSSHQSLFLQSVGR